MLEQLIIAIISAIAKSVELGREAAADKLEDLAKKIRAGALIPDEAFAQAKADADKFEDLEDHFEKDEPIEDLPTTLSGEDDQS